MMISVLKRWFRFSLRTMFLLVTLFGLWLGFELNWIRQRHAFLVQFPIIQGFDDTPQPTAPGLLWLFGERGNVNLFLFAIEGDSEGLEDLGNNTQKAKRLFPESRVNQFVLPRKAVGLPKE